MADVLRCYAAFEESVAHLVASCHIREADSEIRLAVVDKLQFLALRLCKSCVYPTFLPVAQ